MVADDYELIPHEELIRLKKEVEKLKKNNLGNTETANTLLDSMNRLSDSINKLVNILESANDDLIKDYEDTKTKDVMKEIIIHQEKLAKGMIAIGEMIRDLKNDIKLTAINKNNHLNNAINNNLNNNINQLSNENNVLPKNNVIPQNNLNNQFNNANSAISSNNINNSNNINKNNSLNNNLHNLNESENDIPPPPPAPN